MENLNKTVRYKMNSLTATNQTFEDIFNVMHDGNNRIFAELTNGFKIERISYNECKIECIKMASYFCSTLKDYEKNNFIGVLMDNSPKWVYTFWGLLMAGYKPLLLNKRLGDVLNETVVNLVDLKVIISDISTKLNVHHILIDDIDLSNVEIKNDFKWANEIALTTSATSLNVKICVYDGMAISSQIKNTKDVIKKNPLLKKRYNGDIKVLAFLPFYHIFGLVASYFWYCFFNRTLVFLKDLSTGTILNTIKKHEVTHVFAVPLVWHTIYKEVMKQINSKDDKTKKKFYKGIKISNFIQSISPKLGKVLASKMFKEVKEKTFGPSIKCLITGGSYISPKSMELINSIGYPLFNGYGMSEIGITSVELRTGFKNRLRCSIGKPFKSVEYDINKDGCLLVKGKSISHTIISKSGTTHYKSDEWFNTSDLVIKDKNGYYFLNGRVDDVVISVNGEKINPDMLEKQIFIPKAKRISILGLDTETGEKLSLVVELPRTNNKFALKQTVLEINEGLEELKKLNFFIERVYYTYDPIASESAIKVSRKILLKYINEGKVKLMSYNKLLEDTDFNETEIKEELLNQVIAIIADILNIDKTTINKDSHFIIDLGGGSLDYLCFILKLKEEFSIDIADGMELYTPRQACEYIAS